MWQRRMTSGHSRAARRGMGVEDAMLPVTTLAAPAQVQPQVQRGAKVRRPYLYALDPIRVVTALSVLAVHVFEFSSTLNSSTLGAQIQVGASSALHFTREIFMFTTAFVLV